MKLLPDRKAKVDGRRNKVIFRTRSIDNLASAMELAKDRERQCASTTSSSSFTATANIEEYIEMFRRGWEAGISDMAELDGITSDASEQLAFRRAPGGAFPIVPAHLAGHPDSMLMPTMDTSENKRGLTLVVDSCFCGSVEPETIIAYAKDIMRLVAWLQAERIDVAVTAIVPIVMDQKRIVYVTPILRAGDVFQPERIASTLHPSFLRRAWFAMVEHEYYDCEDADGKRTYPECAVCRGGYGTVTSANADELRHALPEAQSVCLLPKPGDGDPKKAVQEILNMKIRTEV